MAVASATPAIGKAAQGLTNLAQSNPGDFGANVIHFMGSVIQPALILILVGVLIFVLKKASEGEWDLPGITQYPIKVLLYRNRGEKVIQERDEARLKKTPEGTVEYWLRQAKKGIPAASFADMVPVNFSLFYEGERNELVPLVIAKNEEGKLELKAKQNLQAKQAHANFIRRLYASHNTEGFWERNKYNIALLITAVSLMIIIVSFLDRMLPAFAQTGAQLGAVAEACRVSATATVLPVGPG